jgi:Lrp/AsnC family transcriptional regulator, leucine-responsive regulatory protein
VICEKFECIFGRYEKSVQIDDLDRRILRHWQADPAAPTAELAARAGVTLATCWRRLDRMRGAGVIRGVEGVIDWRRLGWEVEVSLRFTLDKTAPRAFDEFIAAAREVPEVIEIQTFLGQVDVRLNVIARDMRHYQEVYRSPHPDAAAHRGPRGADARGRHQGRGDASAVIDLDPLDRIILRALVADGTRTAASLARERDLSPSLVARRMRRLEEAGALRGRRVVLDREALGFGVTVFLGVKLAAKGRVSLDDFERAVAAIPEVQTVQHVLGLYDYRLRVVARDISDFERVLRRRIMTLPGVSGSVDANVLLSEERRPGPLGCRPLRSAGPSVQGSPTTVANALNARPGTYVTMRKHRRPSARRLLPVLRRQRRDPRRNPVRTFGGSSRSGPMGEVDQSLAVAQSSKLRGRRATTHRLSRRPLRP